MRVFVFVTVAICTFGVGSVWAADADFHYLAADSSLRATTTNVNVTMCQATYVGKVLDRDQAWENAYNLQFPGTVLKDSTTGQWRMYYEMAVPGQEFQRGVAMATSTDGVHWTKPALNVTGTTYTTSTQNNFVSLPQKWLGGPSVFLDPNASASQRYRMSATVDEATLCSMTSADGVHWASSGVIDTRGSTLALDSLNTTLWDPKTQQYTEYGRWWYDGARRGVYRKQSSSWDGTWSGSRQFVLDPANHIAAGSTDYYDLYTPAIQMYHGQYVGLPSIYHHPGSWSTSGAVYPSFMHSRDGTTWSIPDAYHSMIDLSAHVDDTSTFNGQAYSGTSMVESNGKLYIYYSYFPQNHNSGVESSGEVHLVTLTEDRFEGIQSTAGSIGTWTTSAITLDKDFSRLVVNALVEGSVKVEVLDPTTLQPFAGYALADGVSIGAGDYLDAKARWNGVDGLGAFAGQQVVLRFVLDDATIYGFHFESVPEPSQFVLLCTGLAGLLTYLWKKRK